MPPKSGEPPPDPPQSSGRRAGDGPRSLCIEANLYAFSSSPAGGGVGGGARLGGGAGLDRGRGRGRGRARARAGAGGRGRAGDLSSVANWCPTWASNHLCKIGRPRAASGLRSAQPRPVMQCRLHGRTDGVACAPTRWCLKAPVDGKPRVWYNWFTIKMAPGGRGCRQGDINMQQQYVKHVEVRTHRQADIWGWTEVSLREAGWELEGDAAHDPESATIMHKEVVQLEDGRPDEIWVMRDTTRMDGIGVEALVTTDSVPTPEQARKMIDLAEGGCIYGPNFVWDTERWLPVYEDRRGLISTVVV